MARRDTNLVQMQNLKRPLFWRRASITDWHAVLQLNAKECLTTNHKTNDHPLSNIMSDLIEEAPRDDSGFVLPGLENGCNLIFNISEKEHCNAAIT